MKNGRSGGLSAIFVLLAGLVLFMGPSDPASAHGRSTMVGPTSGLAIPTLTHGQMIVIAQNRAAIIELASQQFPTDPVMRRLEGFINMQAFTCLWGLVPGSLIDEDSPFNACSHAYLAASQALLLHLRTMPGPQARTGTLIRKVETEMAENGASLIICGHSDAPLNTADVINPYFGAIPLDPINMARIILGSLAFGWLALTVVRGRVARSVHAF